MTTWRNPANARGGASSLPPETNLFGLTVVSQDIRFTLDEFTSAQTLTNQNFLVILNASSGSITVTLPAAVNNKNRIYTIKKIDSSGNKVTVDANSNEKIDGETTVDLGLQYDFVTIVSDGDEWFIIGGRNVKLEDLLANVLTEIKDQKQKLREELVHIRLHQKSMSQADILKNDVRNQIDEEDREA